MLLGQGGYPGISGGQRQGHVLGGAVYWPYHGRRGMLALNQGGAVYWLHTGRRHILAENLEAPYIERILGGAVHRPYIGRRRILAIYR